MNLRQAVYIFHENFFLHDIIIFPLGYKIHIFAARNLLVADVFELQ